MIGTEDEGTGRITEPFSLARGDVQLLTLEPTFPHQHYGGGTAQWAQDHLGKPLRMWITCRAADHKPWELTVDVPHVTDEPGAWTKAH